MLISTLLATTDNATSTQYSPRKKSAPKEARTLFPPECIYCDKIGIKTLGKTERPTKFTLASAWELIESQAKMLGNTSLARKVRGFDLCSVEAKHHASCHWGFKNEHHNFIRTQMRVKASRADTEQTHITAAHNEAFDSALQFVQEHIIQQKKAIELSSLRLIYIDKLDKCGYPNDGYCSENHPNINPKLSSARLSLVTEAESLYIVYGVRITVADAVACAYNLASVDKIKDIALLIHGVIRRAFSLWQN